MGFDETRFGRDCFQVFENRIEPFDVADLQDATVLLRKLNQLGGLRGVVGHRFLDQQMFSLLKQSPGKLVMRRGRSDNAQGIAGRGRLSQGTESPHAMFVCDLSRRFRDHIVNASEFDPPAAASPA